MMGIDLEHFDLTGRNALVLCAERPPGQVIAEAYEEAGARVTRLNTLNASEVAQAVKRAAADMGGLRILASAADRFLAKPVTSITADEQAEVMMANYTTQFYACQAGIEVMLQQQQGGNIVLVTHVLGERGLPNTSVYAAAHGAVHNLIRALAQEIAPHGISINGIALGWMEWMGDRLDRTDEEANRALRFPIVKRAGIAADVGPIAVWLAGTAVGYVTGQLFPVDGGLTQHL
jgi:NAD(P)-dependent dehydrogenase (short-subunit alcohol dehydrogenase family)